MTTKSFEFEAALKELEDITKWFESGNADLDQGLVKFERGMELAGQLKTHLASVENRVEKIKQRFSGAAPAPLDDAPPREDPGQAPDNTQQSDLFEG